MKRKHIVPVIILAWIVSFLLLHICLNKYYYELHNSKNSGRRLIKSTGRQPEWVMTPQGSRIKEEPPYIRRDIYEVTTVDIVRLTGPMSWRFFQWGVLSGYSWTMWSIKLNELGVPESIAHATDISNPTPFLITVVILIICKIITIQSRRVKDTN